MADDQTVAELQGTLQDKRDELAQLRADVQAAKERVVNDIAKAQLRAEIEAVEREIALERANLELQEAQNPNQIGAGVAPPVPPELPTPEAPENPQDDPESVADQPNVDQVVKDAVNDDTSNGDEN